MKYTSFILCVSALTLSACGLVEVEYDEKPEETAPVEQEVAVRETKNVTYTGVVQPAGISIYQQGSHRLVLPGGKFILLESDDLDLNGYVEEEVQIFGALRPTVEAGGMIMRVEKIELVFKEAEGADEDVEELELEEESSSSQETEEESSSSEESSEESEASEEASSEATEEESSSGEESLEESSDSSEAAEELEEEPEETTQEPETDEAFTERVAVMARQDYGVANWTQQYCTSHIGYCAPVHKNWWFKSYGATNSTLWHVEFNSEPIESLHQGPIALDLLPGSIGEQSGTVEIVDGKALGYFEWTFGRHFRVSGDASLEAPVRYITENITEYTQ